MKRTFSGKYMAAAAVLFFVIWTACTSSTKHELAEQVPDWSEQRGVAQDDQQLKVKGESDLPRFYDPKHPEVAGWRPAIEDPTGKDLSGYSHLEKCNLVVPDVVAKNPDITQAECEARNDYQSVRAGQEIWIKATGGNQRFYAYNYPQKLTAHIDWWDVLRSDQRYVDRTHKYGMINDPDCCDPKTPGDCEEKFPKKVIPDTFGMDYCPGDDALLDAVRNANEYRKTGKSYRDPACNFKEWKSDPIKASYAKNVETLFSKKFKEDSSCDLQFGTSTGSLGFRKFPNPRFDPEAWAAATNSKGYPEYARQKLWLDHSIEPPFRIGMACAACHIGYNPVNPPSLANITRPNWVNLKPAIGANYANLSAVFASGEGKGSLPWQMFAHARIGTVDTSAFPNDYINNAGSFNPIINLPQRPKFVHQVKDFYNASAGTFADSPVTRSDVYHILKGGEDSVGPEGSVMRVYVNIGTCSEECWTNHMADPLIFDSGLRGFGQTPFDIRQCQADCRNYRAIEKRVYDVFNFFQAQRPTDLKTAVASGNTKKLVDLIETNTEMQSVVGSHKPGSVKNGQAVFIQQCARCHSSQTPDVLAQTSSKQKPSSVLFQEDLDPVFDPKAEFQNRESPFYETREDMPTVRLDFLSNDKLVPVTEVGTYRCRALHSNHMKGHIWQEYASETLRSARGVARRKDQHINHDVESYGLSGGYKKDMHPDMDGPGFMRNATLINIWTRAPFMHNKSIGVELIPKPKSEENQMVYVTAQAGTPAKLRKWINPGVAARLQAFHASFEELMTPSEQRYKKETKTTEDVEIPIAIAGRSYTLVFPKGVNLTLLGSFRMKQFARELYEDAKNTSMPQMIEKIAQHIGSNVKKDDQGRFTLISASSANTFLLKYSNCIPVDKEGHPDMAENLGHDFGTGMSAQEKSDLEAFLLTL